MPFATTYTGFLPGDQPDDNRPLPELPTPFPPVGRNPLPVNRRQRVQVGELVDPSGTRRFPIFGPTERQRFDEDVGGFLATLGLGAILAGRLNARATANPRRFQPGNLQDAYRQAAIDRSGIRNPHPGTALDISEIEAEAARRFTLASETMAERLSDTGAAKGFHRFVVDPIIGARRFLTKILGEEIADHLLSSALGAGEEAAIARQEEAQAAVRRGLNSLNGAGIRALRPHLADPPALGRPTETEDPERDTQSGRT